jgi:hypothetical protein
MVSFDHALDGVARHAAAARALIESKLGFTRDWPDTSFRYCGETADGRGYVFSIGATTEGAGSEAESCYTRGICVC